MTGQRKYDGTLQMFVEPTREVDLTSLRFLRWLGEQGKLEHELAGPSTGEYAAQPVASEAEVALPLAS
jgi:hypothetical protein